MGGGQSKKKKEEPVVKQAGQQEGLLTLNRQNQPQINLPFEHVVNKPAIVLAASHGRQRSSRAQGDVLEGEINDVFGRTGNSNATAMQSPERRDPQPMPVVQNSMGWDEDDLGDEEINAAIMESLLGPSAGRNQEADGGGAHDEEKILKEIMKLSELDYMKNQGGINMDHIKRKKKPQAQTKMESKPNGSTIQVKPAQQSQALLNNNADWDEYDLKPKAATYELAPVELKGPKPQYTQSMAVLPEGRSGTQISGLNSGYNTIAQPEEYSAYGKKKNYEYGQGSSQVPTQSRDSPNTKASNYNIQSSQQQSVIKAPTQFEQDFWDVPEEQTIVQDQMTNRFKEPEINQPHPTERFEDPLESEIADKENINRKDSLEDDFDFL